MTRDSRLRPSQRQRGFSIVAAIFLVVVLALLGAFMVSITGLQVSSHQLDILGARAYQAARAGVEWGAFQVLDPNNDQVKNLANCTAAPMPSCPVTDPTPLAGLAGSLAPFTVTVQCTVSADTTEGNRNVRVYSIVATACNQPSGGSCLATAPTTGYVERQVTATLTKCRDRTASPPRCGCG